MKRLPLAIVIADDGSCADECPFLDPIDLAIYPAEFRDREWAADGECLLFRTMMKRKARAGNCIRIEHNQKAQP